MRSKTRVVEVGDNISLDYFRMGFDGSSTNQATGDNSDCILQPVSYVNDPIRKDGNFLMCEVFNRDGSTHSSNTRSILRNALTQKLLNKILYLVLSKNIQCLMIMDH